MNIEECTISNRTEATAEERRELSRRVKATLSGCTVMPWTKFLYHIFANAIARILDKYPPGHLRDSATRNATAAWTARGLHQSVQRKILENCFGIIGVA